MRQKQPFPVYLYLSPVIITELPVHIPRVVIIITLHVWVVSQLSYVILGVTVPSYIFQTMSSDPQWKIIMRTDLHGPR